MKKILVLIVSVLVTACAVVPYAREVKKKPREGGVIALKTDHRPEDRQRADAIMAANCGSDATVSITDEGEVVVGEKTNSNANKTNENRPVNSFGIGGLSFGSAATRPTESTSVTSETTQLKEWQIAYNCNPHGASNAPAAAPAATVKKRK